jgi:hypothetical protein
MNRRLIPLLLVILAVYTPVLAAQPGPPAAVLATVSRVGDMLAAHGPALVILALVLAAAVALSNTLYRR